MGAEDLLKYGNNTTLLPKKLVLLHYLSNEIHYIPGTAGADGVTIAYHMLDITLPSVAEPYTLRGTRLSRKR